MLYGVWRFGGVIGICMEKIELVQMWALRLFFGVGSLHPKVSLLTEMGNLRVK